MTINLGGRSPLALRSWTWGTLSSQMEPKSIRSGTIKASSDLIDVEIDGTEVLPESLVIWIQKKAPKLLLRDGKLLRLPGVITHLEFLID